MKDSGHKSDPDATVRLVKQAAAGDPRALGDLLTRYEDRLLRAVAFRMDRRLRGRVDPADIVQESYIDATARFDSYTKKPEMPFFLWLRFLTMQKLMQIHREHFGVKARDVEREVSIYDKQSPLATSAVLAAQLLGKHTSPSQAAMRGEIQQKLEQMLNAMEPIDREVLALRHFEQLSNAEAARVLNINESASSSRYVRAIRRLKHLLELANVTQASTPNKSSNL